MFDNPTHEEVLRLVNIESLASGAPVVTFRRGGSPDVVGETCGIVVEKDDVDAMEREIVRICRDKPYSASACRRRAEIFDKNKTFQQYVDLYHEA